MVNHKVIPCKAVSVVPASAEDLAVCVSDNYMCQVCRDDAIHIIPILITYQNYVVCGMEVLS